MLHVRLFYRKYLSLILVNLILPYSSLNTLAISNVYLREKNMNLVGFANVCLSGGPGTDTHFITYPGFNMTMDTPKLHAYKDLNLVSFYYL